MKMRKLINKCIIATFISIASILLMSGCNRNEANKNGTTIVCTIFPIYDWVCEMTEGAEDVNVILLSENGADMHSFQPTVKNVVDIADCDVFIYVGGESEEWINDCISQNPNPDRICINLMEYLEEDVLEESDEGIVQGERGHNHEHEDYEQEESHEGEHEGEDEHHDDHEHEGEGNHHDDHEHEEVETDEHIWLSLRRSADCIDYIGSVIAAKSDYTDKINENTAEYSAKVRELDGEYRDYFDSTDRTVYVLDRFPFGYMMADYDVDYIALFSGCTTDANATFKTVITMSDLLKGTEEKTVYITESGRAELAKTIIDQSGEGLNVRTLNSVQTVSLAKFQEDKKGYLDYMQENLQVLKGE